MARALVLGCITLAVGACATPDLPVRPPVLGREAPEDGDLLAMVPADAEAVVLLDLARLRDSPWTRSVITAASEESQRPRGFDPIRDVDHLVLARLPTDLRGIGLSIARGRFNRARVREAFGQGRPLSDASFRGCTIWTTADQATAFLTDRTLLSGALPSVRAAIDAAYGRARDLRGQAWVDELRARFGKGLPPPAIELFMRVTDPLRALLEDELPEASGLERVGARLEVGRRLDLAIVGTAADPHRARALIARLETILRTLAERPSLVALGFAPLLSQVQLAVKGPRVAAELRLPERQRELLADRLSVLARLLTKAAPAALEEPGPLR